MTPVLAAGQIPPSIRPLIFPEGNQKRVLGVIDERIALSRASAEWLAASCDETVRFDGDVTKVWEDRIRKFWEGADGVLVGFSEPDAQFCLTMLARDVGYRLVHDTAMESGRIPTLPDFKAGRSLELSKLPNRNSRDARFWVIARKDWQS